MTTKQLSILRISLSLIWFYSLIVRWPMISSQFTDAGLFPVSLAQQFNDNLDAFSLNYFFSSQVAQSCIFILSGLTTFLFMLGIRTRMTGAASFLLMLSIDARNQMLLNAGYESLRALQFWCLFLPMDQFYSLGKKNQPNTLLNNWFAKCLILQIFLFYIFGSLFKNSPHWRSSGTALEMALSNHVMTTDFGALLLQLGELLRPLSIAVYYFEFVAPFLILLFWRKLFARKAVLVVLILFHTSIMFIFKIGFLPLVNISALICIWPVEYDVIESNKKRISKVLGIAALLYLLAINVNYYFPNNKFPQQIFYPARTILMDQTWMFFAPHPYTVDAWWSLQAIDENNQPVELKVDGRLLEKDPQDYYWKEVQMEEKTFLIQISKETHLQLRNFALKWLCENSQTAFKPKSISFSYYGISLPLGLSLPRPNYQKYSLAEVDCDSSPTSDSWKE
jgi:hypothetical protein